MEKLVKDGHVRSIGVANFSKKQLKEIMDQAEIKPAVNQFEMHPYFPNNDLLQFCKENNIVAEAMCPLGNPALCPEGPILMEDPVIKEIAKSHGKTPAQVLIRWGLQRGTVVLPKSGAQHRIMENTKVWDFALTPEQMDQLNKLDRNHRIYKTEWWDFTLEQ